MLIVFMVKFAYYVDIMKRPLIHSRPLILQINTHKNEHELNTNFGKRWASDWHRVCNINTKSL